MSLSAEDVTLWCTLIPCVGKENELQESLMQLAKKVKEVEVKCLEYQVIEANTSPDGSPNITFHLLERWTDAAALEKHSKRDWLKEHHNLLAMEQLLVGEESIQSVKVIGGFGARPVVNSDRESA